MWAQRHPIYPRLLNWARAVRQGPITAHCASIEHLYIPERDVEGRRDMPIPIDERDAWRVEQAWRRLPDAARWMIKGDILLRRPPVRVIALVADRTGVAIKRFQYDQRLISALDTLARIIDMAARDSDTCAQSEQGPPIRKPEGRPVFA